jgi:hypothetical protein
MSIHKVYSMKNEIKTNTTRTFLTNDELYHSFALKCRKNKQKIGDRLNALIKADLELSAPVYTTIEEPHLFKNTKTNGSADAES